MTTRRRSGRLQVKKGKYADSSSDSDADLDSDEEPRSRRFDKFKSGRRVQVYEKQIDNIESLCNSSDPVSPFSDSNLNDSHNDSNDESSSEQLESSDSDDVCSNSEEDSDEESLNAVDRKRLNGGFNNAAISLSSQLYYYRKLGVSIPDIPLTEINKDNSTIKLLCKSISNKNLTKVLPDPYHSCEIVLIPPKFHVQGKSCRRIVLKNFNKPNFKIRIFSDSSTRVGPCRYHKHPIIGKSSRVAILRNLGWHAYYLDKEWQDGVSHANNKDNALFDQMRGKIAGCIRSMRKQTTNVEKITWINRSLGHKGCTQDFTEADVMEACKVAMYDGIPEFIMNSADEDWHPYDPLDGENLDATDEGKDEEELDVEEFLDKKSIDTFNLNDSQRDYWTKKCNQKIMSFEETINSRAMGPKMLMTVCLAFKGGLRNRDVMQWLKENFLIDHELLKQGAGYAKALHQNYADRKFQKKTEWFKINGDPHTSNMLYFLNPDSYGKINSEISKWRQKFGSIIQTKLIDKDLWGRIVTLEVDRKGLQKVEKECIDTLVPLTPPKDTSRKYKQREMELKLRTELPLKFLVAVFLKQNGSMPMRKICHWLSINFDHLRHYSYRTRTGYDSITSALESCIWFARTRSTNSSIQEWTIIKDQEGQCDAELRIWRSKYRKQIKKEATNKDIVRDIYAV